jgi:signal transduction histidine kinase
MPLPPALKVTAEELAAVRHDCQRVAVEGIIRSASQYEGGLMFDVTAGTVQFKAYIPDITSAPRDYVDARVRIRGTCGGFYNSRDQFLSLEVLVPSSADITVVDAAPKNYTLLPVDPLRTVLHTSTNREFVHRVRVQGVVTLQRLGRSLFIFGQDIGLQVKTRQMTTLKVGQRVDVAGFPELGEFGPVLRDAVFWPGAGGSAPNPVSVTAEQALTGDHDAELIRLSARLVDTSLRSGYRLLVLQSGKINFEAEIDDRGDGASLPDLEPGSVVQLTGICAIHVNENRDPNGFTVLLRAPSDIAIVTRPSWWTVKHSLAVLACTGVFILVVLGWAAALSRQVSERTQELQDQVHAKERALAELADTQKRLIEMSRLSGMAEVATGVLHNVGNVLNSVNVSANLVATKIGEFRLDHLAAAIDMLQQHQDDADTFLRHDPKGQRLLPYLFKLGQVLQHDCQTTLAELQQLQNHIGHIKTIVATQQNYAKVSGLVEDLRLADLAEDALHIVESGLERHQIRVARDCEDLPPVAADKHKILQILLNLLRNAKESIKQSQNQPRFVRLSIRRHNDDRVRTEVKDSGIGLAPENLTRIFAHGYTTKSNGHGFGLHSGALAAQQMSGSLWAESEGLGRGATFILELPLVEAHERTMA